MIYSCEQKFIPRLLRTSHLCLNGLAAEFHGWILQLYHQNNHMGHFHTMEDITIVPQNSDGRNGTGDIPSLYKGCFRMHVGQTMSHIAICASSCCWMIAAELWTKSKSDCQKHLEGSPPVANLLAETRVLSVSNSGPGVVSITLHLICRENSWNFWYHASPLVIPWWSYRYVDPVNLF